MAESVTIDELTMTEEELDKLAYTKKKYLTPKEIAAYVLVNFGQKNLSQFVDAFKEFFMIQFLKLNTTAYANINLFASIYDAVDDTISNKTVFHITASAMADRRIYDVLRTRYKFQGQSCMVCDCNRNLRSRHELFRCVEPYDIQHHAEHGRA